MAKIFQFPERKINENEEAEKIKVVNSGTEFDFDSKETFIAEMLKKFSGLNLTALTSEQATRFRTLKEKMSGLEGHISQSAYNDYYRSLSERDLSELLPILDNLSDEDFYSRPAYAWAFINVLENKDLASAPKLDGSK